MNSTEDFRRLVMALEKLPNTYESEDPLKQNGYVEGVCDSINAIVRLSKQQADNQIS